jgi:hypothetical protein
LEPLESRLRLFCNEALEAARLFAATVAAKFVLMTTDMVIFLDAKRDVRVTFVSGEAAPDRAGQDICPDRTSYRRAARKPLRDCASFFRALREVFSKPRGSQADRARADIR